MTGPLIRDLVSWIAERPRPYADVMDAWRTSCPRLTIWEDAVDLGYVRREAQDGPGQMIVVTDRGRDYLAGTSRN
ncbi:MAG: hypothetical protein H6873_12290 [Hyphomicrobiaceae bacterium]|nr:hypothetical protein [Hyphomicrobiaceae bacterium]